MTPVDEGCRRGGAGGASGIRSGFAHGAVGVARIDGDDAHVAARRAQVLLIDDEGRGNYAVRSECGGGARWSVGNNQGKVGAAAGLEAGLAGDKAEAERDNVLRWIAHGVDPFNLAGRA